MKLSSVCISVDISKKRRPPTLRNRMVTQWTKGSFHIIKHLDNQPQLPQKNMETCQHSAFLTINDA